MKAKKHIIKWLEKTVKKYPFLYFKYEYSNEEEEHLVCVYPGDKDGDWEAYCIDQMTFHETIDKLFPDETLLFCDNEVLFSCSADALEIHPSPQLIEAD